MEKALGFMSKSEIRKCTERGDVSKEIAERCLDYLDSIDAAPNVRPDRGDKGFRMEWTFSDGGKLIVEAGIPYQKDVEWYYVGTSSYQKGSDGFPPHEYLQAKEN